MLINCYRNNQTTIIASIDEGFGLPLIEAGLYKSRLIARDIPVFREIGAKSAVYFSTTDDLVDLINRSPIEGINKFSWDVTWEDFVKRIELLME